MPLLWWTKWLGKPAPTVGYCPGWWRPVAAYMIAVSILLTASIPLRVVIAPGMMLFERPTIFMPHGHCYFWTPGVLWPTLVGDAMTAVAYYCIPVGLIMVGRWLPPLVAGFAWWFAAFIICCGNTHVAAFMTTFWPYYFTHALIVIQTGVVSFTTLILGVRYYGVITIEARRIVDLILELAQLGAHARDLPATATGEAPSLEQLP